MALSFKESKSKLAQQTMTTSTTMSLRTTTPDVMTLDETISIAAYSGDGGSWQEHTGYVHYSNFADDHISQIDDKKTIVLNDYQFNITQEENSQYIPFEMSRYYDGFDLVNAVISIHYETKSGKHGAAKPINVTYNTEKIRFGWLVDATATQDAGTLKFEIHAYGEVTGSDGVTLGYVWKTKYNDKLNVLSSLCDCKEVINKIDEDNSWVTELVTDVAEAVANQIAEAQVGAQVIAAENAAIRAETAADNAESAATEAVNSILSNYSTTTQMHEYVSQEISNADIEGKLTAYIKKDDVNALIGDLGESDTVVSYVNAAVDAVDVSEQLKEYAKSADVYTKTEADQKISDSLTTYATKDDVSQAISDADISEKLNDYYKKEETYNRDEIDNKISNVTVDLTGYATEKYVDDKVSPLSSSISTNAENISALSTTVGDLQSTVGAIDTSPRLTYDVDYNDTENPDVGENVFVFYEIENEGKENEVREAKKKFTIVGGGGGGATSSTLKIGYITTSPFVVTTNDKAIIKYTFSGTDSSGDAVTEGTATWKVAGKIVATNIAINGENTFDVTDYLSIGTQKVNLSIVDEAGSLVTKTWTVQKIDVRLESTFNDKLTYPLGTVAFDYTPYGAISKVVHFVLDGTEIGTVTTTSSGIPTAYELPAQTHGAHLVEVYMTAEINGNTIESNHIVKDIIWYDNTSSVPVISTVYQDFTARQYDATNIEYTVYDPSTETPSVVITVDGTVVSTPTLDKATNVYTFKTDVVGEHIITITCGTTVKSLKANITKLDIDITPVTAGLAFDFNPSGKSNNDTDRIWSDGTVSMSVSDNFDWVNGGYQYDATGDQYFCIKAGTSAEIDYKLFADDSKKNGKEMKLVFKTTNVAKPDATFLSCMDNTTDSDHIGIQMDVHEAFIYGQADKLHLPYSEEDIIEFEFNISKNTEAIPMVMGYEDGVSTRPMVYDDSYNFTQNTPKVISLGSPDCDLHIYRFKVYNTSLTDRGILNNFIADARNAEEMIARYDRNQIYDENQNLDPDVLAEKCPWLRVYKVSAPYFTNNKSDKVPNTTIEQIYKNGDAVLDNWTCYNAQHSGQGTSSNNYGAAGRNLDFIMNKSGIEGVDPYFKLGDGTEATKITMTRTSVPVAYLNAKVNIASSNNLTNALLANRYNEFNPYKRPFVRDEGVDTSFIKDTMGFYNCVIFIQETNEDISTHREFADTNWHFYAIGNVGDSKKTDKTRLTDQSDKYECCVEIMDVELPLSDFPVDTMYNAMGYKVDEKTNEKIYIWAKNENLGILYEKINGEYVLTTDTEINLEKTYYVDILEHDDFSEDFTYGWRYIYEGDDDEENAEVFDYCKQRWIELYRFITTSTDEEFKARLGEYFVLDSALYYYLFTTRYCMVDNRAKNTFWHYGKTGEVDTNGNPIRKWDLCWDYDNDTACGLNNYGKQVYRYGLEDIDTDEKGEEVFREADSTFFCRVRDLFSNELKAMYNTLESKNAWHAESFLNAGDEWQSEFPEELWRIDIERKYIRTYNGSFINGKGDAQFLVNMANGKMKYHRRQWERSQAQYMASKYQSSVASSDNSVFRCSVPTGNLVVKPNYKLKLTPYAYMYLNVKYGTQNPIQLRATPNVVYEIPFEGEKADIVDIYSSSLIQDFGDLSSCYVATADTSKASKVKKLIFGNDTVGYDNPNFTTLTTGANYLLETLNIENVSGLTQSLNLTALNNLKELYAHGSNIGGVTFADGGRLEIAELPAINALSMKNLMYLTTLDITDLSRLTTLTVENCNAVDLLDVLNHAPSINRIRLTGVNWSLEDNSLLERIYAMKGIDKNGYNTDKSVLAGTVHVPIMKEKILADYNAAWPDLEITYNTLVQQYTVTFQNDDGTVLDVQYVDKGTKAVDPLTRADNPINTPIKASTVSTDYTFIGWDKELVDAFDNQVIIATYSESIRKYTIKYVSQGTVVQESVAQYGTNVVYHGETPTYTLEESAYKYYLFDGWDQGGYVSGNKTIHAVYDSCEYKAGYFNSKELKNLRPVELYMMMKLSAAGVIAIADYIDAKDSLTVQLGTDINYSDVEDQVLIGEKTVFVGNNHIDTGIQLLSEDRDFVLAIDYKMDAGNSKGAVLAQCFSGLDTSGFKLAYNDDAKIIWGSALTSASALSRREVVVIRHIKGDNGLHVYTSNIQGAEPVYTYLDGAHAMTHNVSLVFGCNKLEDGSYEQHSKGTVYWSKVWYADLGDEICSQIAYWPHEEMVFEACCETNNNLKRYYLSDNSGARSSVTFIATTTLSQPMIMNPSTTTNGDGWGTYSLNRYLNNRFYHAIAAQWRQLIKQVKVKSSIGNKSTEVTNSDCYIFVPSISEVAANVTEEPYSSEGTLISHFSSNASRICYTSDGVAVPYWTRSPNAGYNNYVYRINMDGSSAGITTLSTADMYVRTMFSM